MCSEAYENSVYDLLYQPAGFLPALDAGEISDPVERIAGTPNQQGLFLRLPI